MSVQNLANRSQSSSSTVSRTFLIIIHVLYRRLTHLLYWPERDELRKTMPLELRKHFGLETVVRLFKIFKQRPQNMLARAKIWSLCKHNNTVKFLIVITPQGPLSFVSYAWGGRISHKNITDHHNL